MWNMIGGQQKIN